MEIFYHPPNLPFGDYFLFLHFKLLLELWKFDNDNKLKNGVTLWFKLMVAEFVKEGMKKLVKCFQNVLKYVQKIIVIFFVDVK